MCRRSNGFCPKVDLFASPCNLKIKKYYTRDRCSQAIRVDALSNQWNFNKAYAFPPLPIIFKFLRKLQVEAVEVEVIAPYWPNMPWFPLVIQLSFRDSVALPPRPDLLSRGSPAPLSSVIENDGLVLERKAGIPRVRFKSDFHPHELEKGEHQ